jgi:hypothetical protein
LVTNILLNRAMTGFLTPAGWKGFKELATEEGASPGRDTPPAIPPRPASGRATPDFTKPASDSGPPDFMKKVDAQDLAKPPESTPTNPSGASQGQTEGGKSITPDFTAIKPDVAKPADGNTGTKGGDADSKAGSRWNQGQKPDVNWMSRLQFGHTFDTHGKNQLKNLIGRAAGTGEEQGVWNNNQKAAEFLSSLNVSNRKVVYTKLPEGLGSYIKPDGSVIPATHVAIVPFRTKSGIRVAYPISEEQYGRFTNH